ncbi:MAG: DUF1186 domain-containing protein [Bacillota bacterium]|nr:DUF1186 domain-containing protein [Bacillota bacterium]
MANNESNERLIADEIDYKSYSISQLVKEIEYIKKDFPEAILKEIIQRKDEATPVLLDILKSVKENHNRYAKSKDYFAHIYAIFILAQFKETKAYPLYVELLKLPGNLPYDLFGDSLCESTGMILASLCGNDLSHIKELVVNSAVDESIRGHAVGALAILAVQGVLSREDMFQYFKDLLADETWDKNSYIIAELVSACNDIYPEEIIEDIRSAYQNNLVDDSIIDLGYVETTLKDKKENVIENFKNDIHHQFIDDAIEDLRGWGCYVQADETKQNYIAVGNKIGPNDLCPCGSGRKYKKCCG